MRRAAVVLALASAFVLGGFTQQALAEDPPKLGQALVHLRYALGALNKAPADKGGHRQKAIELTEKAVEEINKAMAAEPKR
ncbi:hypothetical protein [Melittangium boletus]|jgi:hypothetical protein|uniref:hypothetical protein n=1 Tax=Melittangium boletus TaxID=83453 RepID=UPI003DA2637A